MSQEPELLWDTEEDTKSAPLDDIQEITPELVKQMLAFDRERKRLEDYKFLFMKESLEKPLPWDDRTIKFLRLNYEKLKKYGFRAEKK